MSVNWDEIICAGIEKLEKDYYNLGESLYQEQKYQAAIAQYTRAIDSDANYYQAYLRRGAYHFMLGRNKLGIKDYDRAIKIKPDFADGYYHRGYASKVLGDLAGAIADFSHVVELEADHTNIYYYRGAVYSYLGDYELAIADFTKVIDVEPNSNNYYNRGVIYYLTAKYSQAIADFTQAISLKPQFVSAYLNLGNAYFELSDCQQASNNYKKAKEINQVIDPQDEHGYYAQGIAAYNQEEILQGIKYLREAAFICRETNNYALNLKIAALIKDLAPT